MMKNCCENCNAKEHFIFWIRNASFETARFETVREIFSERGQKRSKKLADLFVRSYSRDVIFGSHPCCKLDFPPETPTLWHSLCAFETRRWNEAFVVKHDPNKRNDSISVSSGTRGSLNFPLTKIHYFRPLTVHDYVRTFADWIADWRRDRFRSYGFSISGEDTLLARLYFG